MRNLLIAVAVTAMGLAACSYGPDSPRGFSLPEGNPQRGAELFEQYNCVDCHRVANEPASDDKTYLLSQPIVLSSKSSRITTYGELVTSIINPSHKLSPKYPLSLTSSNGESKMRNINDILTVADLIDLVAYLQPQYEVVPYRMSEYRLYELRTVPETH